MALIRSKRERQGERENVFSQKQVQEQVQEGEKMLQELIPLKNPSEREFFLLEYARAVCRFRLASFQKILDTNPFFFEEVCRSGGKADHFGVNQDDLMALNRAIAVKNKKEVEQLARLLGI